MEYDLFTIFPDDIAPGMVTGPRMGMKMNQRDESTIEEVDGK